MMTVVHAPLLMCPTKAQSAFFRLVLVDAVFREAYGHGQNRAGCKPCERLQQPLRDYIGILIGLACRIDDDSGECLQEIAAERATTGSGDGVPNHAEGVLLHRRGDRMRSSAP
jgi:hypothetical protein